ncbi:MAG TPA: glycosyltransferase [Pyrinomonadaceae bacterium]
MRFLIDGQTLLTAEINRGIGTYFKNTVENILENDFTNDFYLNTPDGAHLNALSPWAREKLSVIDNPAYDIRAPHYRGGEYQAELYSDALNNDVEKLGIDLYWSPNALMDNVFLPTRQTNTCQFAVTIFDLIISVMEQEYAKHWPPATIATHKNKLKQLERDYDLYLHISQHTQSDFMNALEVKDKKHIVTPLAANSSFRPYPFPDVPTPNDYVLYIGGFDPRKNMDRAIEAFANLQTRHGADQRVGATELCIVCSFDNGAEGRLLDHARQLGLKGKVRLAGFMDDAALLGAYQKARCLFFPSLYEGFGLPILEGLACGLPVAASNSSSLPEVGGKLANYFDPYNVDEMADGLYAALRAPMDYESRLERYEYSKRFSWQRTALATLQAFAECAKEKPNRKSEDRPTIMSGQELNPDFIDVRKRIEEVSVEELCQTAEEFFARLDNWDYLHAKPFAAIGETPELLINFAQVLQGLNLLPGMTILDFGAGSCWTSRFLSQLGLEVIALDVSKSALEIGQELYKRLPVIGDQPPPRFLQFDGHSLDLPDECVDRISCWDAFHHVPNPRQVIKEMARVLKEGGIAGFSEPGPDHSKSAQSQYEMRTNRIIENDINVRELWSAAQEAGFTKIKLAFSNPAPFLLPLEVFEEYLDGKNAGERFVAETREQMQHRRILFFFKGESSAPRDSRQREGLSAELHVKLGSDRIAAGKPLRLEASVRNTGSNVWLPTTARVGAVHFGIHLFDTKGILLDLDYYRHNLTPDDGREILPGETVEFKADVPMPAAGKYTLQCDLVSEAVCWFEHNGSPTVRIKVHIT